MDLVKGTFHNIQAKQQNCSSFTYFIHTDLHRNLCVSVLSVQFSSVAQSCPTLCDPMNRGTPGLPVHHQLPEFTQTHVHRVGDAIEPSHPLSSPSPPAPNPSQHQGLFQWVNSSREVAKVLEFQLQHQSFQWTPRTDLLQDGLVGSPCSPRDSQESSPTPQFKSIHSLALSFLHSLVKAMVFPVVMYGCESGTVNKAECCHKPFTNNSPSNYHKKPIEADDVAIFI